MNRALSAAKLILTVVAFAATGTMGLMSAGAHAQELKELRVDYAYYSPPSLVLKRFGWLEEEFKKDGTQIKWVLSQGSNRALEFLNAGSLDFGSTAGLAAVLSRANGNPIKAVYVYSRPEWASLVVAKDSPIKSIADLKGKKIAATKGTDPYLFLLRALASQGLHKNDIEHVHLQHGDGRVALERKSVDAWAGLDPHTAASELESGSRLLYRNVEFNTYGFLNVSENFARNNPDAVKRVIRAYERARLWILANPKEAVQLVADETKLSPQVAQRQLERNDFSSPLIGPKHAQALKAAAPILVDEQLVKPGTNVAQVIDELIEPAFALAVIKPATLATQ